MVCVNEPTDYRHDVDHPFTSRVSYTADGKPVCMFYSTDTHDFARPLPGYPDWHGTLLDRNTNKLLIAHGIDPPDPLDNYPYPGPFEPYAHQPHTVRTVVENPRCWVLDDPRTGKTLGLSWALDNLFKRGDIKRVLILCPRRIINSTWMKTLFQVMPDKRVESGAGPVKKFAKRCNDPSVQIIVANHDKMLTGFKYINAGRFDMVIVDESNMFRHSTADRSQMLKRFTKKPRLRVVFMTGTVNTGLPETLYDLCRIINPQSIPTLFTKWRDLTQYSFFKGEDNKVWKQKSNVEHLIVNALRPCSRARREDCFDLPEVTHHTEEVPLVSGQATALKKLLKDKVVHVEDQKIRAANAAVLVGKVLQVSCGVAYDTERESVIFDKAISERVNVCIEQWKETGSKVVVLCAFTAQLEAVAELLRKRTRTRVLTLYGKTTDNESARVEPDFQTKDDVQFLVADPDSVMHGFTLSAANSVVWLSPTHKTETWVQANDRPFGALSASKTHIGIVVVVSTPAEKMIYAKLRSEDARSRDELDLIALANKLTQ
jgi:superfamily II DNA or RNA helicase